MMRIFGRVSLVILFVFFVTPIAGEIMSAQTKRQGTPVRQNPNVDRPITNEGFDSTVILLLQKLVAAYGPIASSNDRPNPYTRVEPFGEPPQGITENGQQ